MSSLAKTASKPIVTCVRGVKPLVLERDGDPVDDPHAWFNCANAAIYVKNIQSAIAAADPAHADEYQARTDLYLIQLRALD